MSLKLRQHLEEMIPLSDEEFDHVLSYFKEKRFSKHQFVIQEGNNADYEYFVLAGLLKAYYINEEGKEHIIQFAMENWWITDYQAFFKREKALLNIDCLENVSLLAISLDNKQRLCAASQKMEHFFRMKTTAGYISLQQRILSLLNNNARAKYEQFLTQYPSLFQRLPKTLVAAYLGVSRETLSRLQHS